MAEQNEIREAVAQTRWTAEDYEYKVEWSAEDEAFVARVTEFPSLAADGETEEKALEEIKFVVKDVLQDLVKNKEMVPMPQKQQEKWRKLFIFGTK